ncbi:hypothetical protein [Actinoplanes solisilvae]|uniref:hypothetical protein n=1 Tax=Actinoplanes solisilvae TaxID=2486853 RepID=UPI000FD709D1|nr:hypothetical protein [Actinoplanes solisilvae]
MNTSLDTRLDAGPKARAITVVPVLDGERPVGAWIVNRETAVFRPVVDVTGLAGAILAVAGAIAVTTVAVARRRAAIGAVTMGPGGWVSVRGAASPRPRARTRRPWWARLIGAHPLVTRDRNPRRPHR